MKHKDLVSALSQKTGLATGQIDNMIQETVRVITSCLEEEGSVMISGFGTLEVRKKAERISYNPTTKERVLIPPKLTANFKPSDTLKDALANE